MKTLARLALVFLATWDACAQGTVNFSNGSGSLVMTGMDCPVPVGTMFKAALYFHPDQPTPPSHWDFDARGSAVGAPTTFGPLPGYFFGGTRIAPVLPGAPAWFQVRVWEAAFGATYEEAWNHGPIGGRLAIMGTSNSIRVTTGNPTTQPPGIPASLVVAGLQGFCLGWCNSVCIPEPSSLGLLLLGAGVFVLAIRRGR